MNALILPVSGQGKIKGELFIDSTRDPAGNRVPFKWPVAIYLEQGETSGRVAPSFAPPLHQKGLAESWRHNSPLYTRTLFSYHCRALFRCRQRTAAFRGVMENKQGKYRACTASAITPSTPFPPRSLFIFFWFTVVLPRPFLPSFSLSSNRTVLNLVLCAMPYRKFRQNGSVERWAAFVLECIEFPPDSGIFIIHLSYFCFVFFFSPFFGSGRERENRSLETDNVNALLVISGEKDHNIHGNDSWYFSKIFRFLERYEIDRITIYSAV